MLKKVTLFLNVHTILLYEVVRCVYRFICTYVLISCCNVHLSLHQTQVAGLFLHFFSSVSRSLQWEFSVLSVGGTVPLPPSLLFSVLFLSIHNSLLPYVFIFLIYFLTLLSTSFHESCSWVFLFLFFLFFFLCFSLSVSVINTVSHWSLYTVSDYTM